MSAEIVVIRSKEYGSSGSGIQIALESMGVEMLGG